MRSFGLRVWGRLGFRIGFGLRFQGWAFGAVSCYLGLGMYRVSYRMQGCFVELEEGLAAWCCLLRASEGRWRGL